MKIKINSSIFVIILIFLITGQLKNYGILMLFAFIHELGHLLIGVIFKFKPKILNVIPMGFNISFKIAEINNKNIEIKKIIVAMSGPAVNIIILFLLEFMDWGLNDIDKINYMYSNILIALFNLLPIYPLDGGRIIRGIIKIKLGKLYSIRIGNIISKITLSIITGIAILMYKNIAILFILTYLWCIIIIQNKKDKMQIRMYEVIKRIENI